MNTMDAVIRAREIKTHSLALRGRGDVAGAIAHLRKGAQILRETLVACLETPPGGEAERAAWELADCLGMLGGNLLRHGDVQAAITMFQEGRDIELGRIRRLGLTYCTVNLVIARLLNGGWQALPPSTPDLDEVALILREQISGHPADLWASADLGMCEFLRGRFVESEAAFGQAQALASPNERRSLSDRLLMLKDKCAGIPARERLYLESAISRLA